MTYAAAPLFLCALVGLAFAPRVLPAQEMPFNLVADELNYSGGDGVVEARGGVEVTGPQGRLRSDSLRYDPATDKVMATGNVVLTDPDGAVLLADELELSGDFKTGALQELKLNVPGIGEPGIPVLDAAKAERLDEDTFVLTDATYSPCKTCGDTGRRPWTVHAKKATYDKAEGMATYQHAWMDAFGVPIMYLPYLAHPLGPKKAKSGLLMPQFGTSTSFGENVTLAGYVVSPRENADYTFRTRLMGNRGAQLMAERRQSGLTHDNEVKASFLNDTGRGEQRGHLKFVGEKVIDEGRRLGLNSEVASDDSYLTEFFGRTDPYLRSVLYAEDGGETHYAGFQTALYQDLRPQGSTGSTAQVLPQAELAKWFAQDDGSEIALHFDTLNLDRETGVRYRRITTGADYTLPVYLEDGSFLQAGASLRMDMYNVDGLTGVDRQHNGNSGRFLPEASLSWEKPFVSPDGWHTIAPRVMGVVSPRGSNPDGIPNEDSVAYELDHNNLFETSRFAGLDRVESGPRLMWGLDNRWGDAGAADWRVFIGQSYRRFDDDSLPASGGASTNVSDWVGYLRANPVPWFRLDQRFRLDNATFETRRMDTSMMLGSVDDGFFRATYSFLSNGPEELFTEAEYPLTDNIRALANARQDLVDDRLLQGELGLRFTADCYQIELVARRRGFTNGDLQPATDYMLNLQLLTFGTE